MYELSAKAQLLNEPILIRIVQNRMTAENEKVLDEIQKKQSDYIVSVHKVGYFADRHCIFSPNGCENAFFKEVCP
jgi:DNA topoisomerase IA